MSSFPFPPRTISLVDRHSGIYQGTGRCRCSHSTGAITADTVQIERSGCSGTSADSEHLYSITHTWESPLTDAASEAQDLPEGHEAQIEPQTNSRLGVHQGRHISGKFWSLRTSKSRGRHLVQCSLHRLPA